MQGSAGGAEVVRHGGSFGCRLGPSGARGAQCRQIPQIVPICVIRAMDRRGHRGAQIDASLLSFLKERVGQ
jgi:hypothetical protein